ncbi:MAG: phosphoribosylformylglycinamidine cyclo-ligase [Baekduia sp.]
MSDAYAAAGVDTDQADTGVAALVGALGAVAVDGGSRVVPLPGHYASVIRVAPNLGIAIGTDGVGSKLVVAEQLDRLETVGIDCVAMNVNDLICVGAEPVALVDYLAVEEVSPERMAMIGEGLREGAQQANCEIPGGEVAVIPELIRGHPSPDGFDLCATAIGTVALDGIVDGSAVQPGDALIGLPSSGIHSNGYTLARKVLSDFAEQPPELGGASVGDALLEPTVIYVRAVLDLLRSDIPIHGLAHITGGGLTNLLRIGRGRVGYRIDDPLSVPPVFGLIAERGGVSSAEMWEVFNMGCGFVAMVPDEHAAAAAELLAAHHPGSRRIGTVTEEAGSVTVPSLSIALPGR